MSLLAFERLTLLTQSIKYALAMQLVQAARPDFMPNEIRQAIAVSLMAEEFLTPRNELERMVDKIQRAPHVPVETGPQGSESTYPAFGEVDQGY